METGRKTQVNNAGREGFSPRLSPVELRNLQLINDPAVSGYHQGGRKPFGIHVGDGEQVDLSVSAGGNVARLDVPVDRPVVEQTCCQGFRYTLLPEGGVRLDAFTGGESAVAEDIELAEELNAAKEAGTVRGRRVTIPQQVEGRPVLQIEPGLFAGFDDVLEIRLGQSPEGLEPAFTTDGLALYSADGSRLLQLAAHCSSYQVSEACVEIAPRSFDSAAYLKRVELPQGLRSIGRLAFAKSGLQAVEIPSSVEVVGEKAFYSCRQLTACTFAPGLRVIGVEAFANSGLARAVLPATLQELGAAAFNGTPAQKRLAEAAIVIDERNLHLSLDESGGLYAGGVLLEYLGCSRAYEVRPGTWRIGEGACRRNQQLQAVVLPEGVGEIGDEAFRGCRNLEYLALPESLEQIGARAFMDTRIRELHLSKNVLRIGESALLVQGESPQHAAGLSAKVELDPDNIFFYVESGLLCQRGGGDAGGDACVLYVGPDNIVRIPQAVNRLLPNAMSGASGIDELYIHGHLHSICRDALTVARSIPVLHVEFAEPLDGCPGCDFIVPSLSARYRVLTNLLTTSAKGTVFDFDYYDSWVSNATRLEEFAPAALQRLANPVRLSARSREVYLGIIARKQGQICRLFSKAGNMGALELMCSLGVLGRDTVEEEIQAAADEGQAQAMACLLELKRRQGWAGGGLDLSI
ncbi:MAG: leucine-rich repeat domain-containing protein [Coriobacteriales bacterium]